jgi:hypothetical protein
MQKWEYCQLRAIRQWNKKVDGVYDANGRISSDPNDLLKILNEQGQEGWRLVTVIHERTIGDTSGYTSATMLYTLERVIQE